MSDQLPEVPLARPLEQPSSKKKIGAYLIEFVLLFLAVFLGFVAENIREDVSDKKVVEEQMRAMVENLRYDTARLGRSLRLNLGVTKGLDSFRFYIRKAINGDVKSNKLYYFKFKCMTFGAPYFNKLTISQLKNSGLIRSIENDSLVEQISGYDERQQPVVESRRDGLSEITRMLTASYRNYFSFEGFDAIIQRDTIYTPGKLVAYHEIEKILYRKAELKLLTTDPLKLELLYSEISEFEYSIHQLDAFIRDANESALALIKRINEEYHFEKK